MQVIDKHPILANNFIVGGWFNRTINSAFKSGQSHAQPCIIVV